MVLFPNFVLGQHLEFVNSNTPGMLIKRNMVQNDEWMADLQFYILFNYFSHMRIIGGFLMKGYVQWNHLY